MGIDFYEVMEEFSNYVPVRRAVHIIRSVAAAVTVAGSVDTDDLAEFLEALAEWLESLPLHDNS